MKVNFNQLDRGYEKYREEYNEAAIGVLESGWYTLGNQLKCFEKNFSNFIGSRFCIGVNSGLDALILAIRALDICAGDEVIVPANTYIASVLAITENGAIPVFVDCDEYYGIDVNKIEEKITTRTKAILVVHLYGQPVNLLDIKLITERYSLYLIEDCAQSHGAKFMDRNTGTWGDIGCFSFYPTKNLGAFGDAGCIVTDNKDIYEKIELLRNYGSKVKYQNEILGINSRMDEIQAALLNVKLRHYVDLMMERNKIVYEYLSRINNPMIELPRIRENSNHIWHLFVVKVNDRERFQSYLSQNEITTQIHYPVPPYLSQAYNYLGEVEGNYPVTEDNAKRIISLPIFDGMTQIEVDYLIETVNLYK